MKLIWMILFWLSCWTTGEGAVAWESRPVPDPPPVVWPAHRVPANGEAAKDDLLGLKLGILVWLVVGFALLFLGLWLQIPPIWITGVVLLGLFLLLLGLIFLILVFSLGNRPVLVPVE